MLTIESKGGMTNMQSTPICLYLLQLALGEEGTPLPAR